MRLAGIRGPSTSMDEPDNPFWRFSLDRYRRDGVAPLCLQAQDDFAANVNLVLFGLWLGTQGKMLTEAGAHGCRACVSEWHANVVVPMRGVRRWMKTCPVEDSVARNRLRAAIQKEEIEAERMEHDMLHRLWVAERDALCEGGEAEEAAMAANAARFCTTGAGTVVSRLVQLCR